MSIPIRQPRNQQVQQMDLKRRNILKLNIVIDNSSFLVFLNLKSFWAWEFITCIKTFEMSLLKDI